MDTRIHAFHPPPLPAKTADQGKNHTDFAKILKERQDIQLSKHASERMEHRSIQLTPIDLARMSKKLEEAKEKGVKESLVIMEQGAFIVNAESKKIITAMDRTEMTSKIFTNINGTILID